MKYSVVGCDFNVNESTASIKLVSLNRSTHKTRVCIDCWKCAQRLRDAPLPVFPLRAMILRIH